MPAGLQPPRLGTLQRRVDRYWAAVQDCCTELDKYQVGAIRRYRLSLLAPSALCFVFTSFAGRH
jgi:hypothetical protein